MFREFGELLYGRRFPLRLKGAVYKSYVRPAMLYGSEAWCLKESEINILNNRKIHGESNVWSTSQRHRKIYGFDVHVGLQGNYRSISYGKQCWWYGYVLRREDGHVLRRALDFEVEGQRKKWKLNRTWKRQVEEESMKVGLRREDALCRSKWSVGVNKIASGRR